MKTKQLALEQQLEGVQKDVVNLLEQTQAGFNKMSKNHKEAIGLQSEIITAMVEVIGTTLKSDIADLISNRIKENREVKAKTEADNQKAMLEGWKTQGLVRTAESVSELTFLVTRDVAEATETTPEKVIGPGFALTKFVDFKDEYKALVAGKKVGDTFSVQPGVRTEVLELWDVDQEALQKAAASKESTQAVA